MCFQNFANASAEGANSLGRTARRLTVFGAGSVYLVPHGGTSEKLYGEKVPAGAVITQQFVGIGPSTSATDLAVQFD
ncbi:MAG: hypothetical protein CMJ58_16870 [Planctomycetaceae bacterium]|nr:hypothetical protein [Planctomycetaceae bacterium]